MGEELSDTLDAELAAAAAPWGEQLAVVAVGGYGRRELCLHSDVDLVILHQGEAPREAVRAILYPRWDAGTRLGHATLTPRQAVTLGRERLESLCSLLTARPVAGRPDLVDELTQQLAKLLRRERSSLELLLAGEEHALWRREPFPRQDLDLKTGRGALRSLHRLDWDRRRAELTGSEPPLAASPEETAARRTLLAARAALHAVRGRAADRYALELREAVGRWLQRPPLEVAQEVYRAARTVDGLASVRWGRVRPGGVDPVDAGGRAVVQWVRSRWLAAGSTAAVDAPLAAARRAAASFGGHLTRFERGLAGSAAPPSWTDADRRAWLELLAAGRAGWTAISGLWESGWVERALPELGHLAGLPQAAPFHLHPVDAHLGRTVDEVVQLAGGDDPWCAELCERLGSLDELLLAAWLHDAGKGLGGDHSEVGAELAGHLLGRLGFASPTRQVVAVAVRHHLLLAQMLRRDPADPRVVASVAAQVGDRPTLAVLAVLAAADARATGPDAWSPWRRQLLRGLVERVDAELEGTGPSRLEAEWSREVARLLAGEAAAGLIDSHLEQMPPGYLLQAGPELAAAHLRLLTPPRQPREVRMAAVSAAPASTVVVASRDRPGLLATITGVLALHGLSVVEARAVTRKDGVAVDTFRVVDALGGDMAKPSRWPAVRADLVATLAGELDLAGKLAAKQAAYPPPPGPPPWVELWEEGGDTLLEVRAPDRLGLLHALTEAIAARGMGIRLAKVETRSGEAIDTFTLAAPERLTSQAAAGLVAAVRRAAGGESAGDGVG